MEHWSTAIQPKFSLKTCERKSAVYLEALNLNSYILIKIEGLRSTRHLSGQKLVLGLRFLLLAVSDAASMVLAAGSAPLSPSSSLSCWFCLLGPTGWAKTLLLLFPALHCS